MSIEFDLDHASVLFAGEASEGGMTDLCGMAMVEDEDALHAADDDDMAAFAGNVEVVI